MRNDSGVLSSGALVANRYRLDERLATGGMGEVWRATDTSLGRTVAVKVLLPALLADPKFGSRFRAEARMLATLHHPGVVRIFDYGESREPAGGLITYLVMEYVEGEALSRRLEQCERLSVQETMDIVAQAAAALHAAHTAGIVHRDVKPSNLLLRPAGSVMLVDFGVARSSVATTSITSTNAIIGTAMYMAPEQASGGAVSAATDIYALGAVAHHCLAGKAPFTGGSPLEIALRHVTDEPPELPADVPEAVRNMVRRALAKNPEDRYPTAASLARAARRCGGTGAGGTAKTAATSVTARTLSTRPAIPRPVPPATKAVDSRAVGRAVDAKAAGSTTQTDELSFVEKPVRWTSIRVALAAAAAVVLLALAGFVVAAFLPGRGSPPAESVVSPSQSLTTRDNSPTPTVPEIGHGPATRRNPGAPRIPRASESKSATPFTPSPTPPSPGDSAGPTNQTDPSSTFAPSHPPSFQPTTPGNPSHNA